MLNKLSSHDYQTEAIDAVLRDKRTLIKAPTGAGKTLVGVEAILRAGTKVNLIIAPLHTFTGWEHTFRRQGGADLQFIDARKKGKEAHEALAMEIPGNYFIGRERLRTQSWTGWNVDFVVLDECQSFTNHKSLGFKMLKTLKPEYAIAMSATPAGNNFQGLFSVTQWLWPEFTGKSYWKWLTSWARTEPDPYSYAKVVGEAVPGKYLASIPSYVSMPSIYKETPNIFEIEVELGAQQRKHYKEVERDSITFLDENPLITELPATRYMRLLQMTLAVPTIEQIWDEEIADYRDHVTFSDDAKSAKADALEDLLKDIAEENVMVYTHSKQYATYLTKRLQRKGFEARQWIGGMSKEEKHYKLTNFGKDFNIMVATLQSIGEGTDGLQHISNTEVWMSVSDNRYLNIQAQGRLSRQGQEETVNRYVIRAKETVELSKQHPRITVDTSILEASFQEVEHELDPVG